MAALAPESILQLGRDLVLASRSLRDAGAAAEHCPSAEALAWRDEARTYRDRLLDQWPRQRDPS